MRRVLALLLLFLTLAPRARAESNAESNAEVAAPARPAVDAEELYERGLAKFREARFSAACEDFRASFQLDPLPGVLFTLATCESRAGRVATAARRYEEFLKMVEGLPEETRAKEEARVNFAESELESLRPKIPYLTLALEGSQDSTIARLDGRVIAPDEWEKPKAVDPGAHVLTLVKKDGSLEEKRVVVAPGEQVRLVVGSSETSPAQKETEAVAPAPAATSRRKWAYASAGVGAVGLVVGSVFGALAMGETSEAKSGCPGGDCGTESELKAAQSAALKANLSTAGFAVGLAGASVGAVLYFGDKGSSADGRAASLRLTGRGVQLRGTF